jgi:hypothetical protein
MSLIEWQVSLWISTSSQLPPNSVIRPGFAKFLVDGSCMSHNPKVGGSNPPPATQESDALPAEAAEKPILLHC